ncbi:MAG: protease modulator HflC [Rhodospirillaceae bacterium]|nr:protease modulator HflC [Rhodospirillaceae bacterium]MBT5375109.1 protease modulator HflC [Rhodospirillaceae bacterium]MBT5659083.1 protease modulator HflC [Rhodospirillaceae bacterium]
MSSKFIGITGLALVVLAVTAFGSLYTVNQIQQAVVFQFGKPIRIVTEPGLHVKMPFVQNVDYYDKRVLDFNLPVQEPITDDQKKMLIDSFARYRIVDPLKVFQTVRTEAVIRTRIDGLINSAMRNVVGNVPLTSLLSKEREQIMLDIRNQVNGEVAQFGIEVIDVRIRRADLPSQNSQAIFERMKSQREQAAKKIRSEGAEAAQRIRAEADKNRTVILAEARKKGEILRGEGDGAKNDILAKAYGKDAVFFDFYRSMQSYRSALGSDGTTMVLSPDSEFFRYFNQSIEK